MKSFLQYVAEEMITELSKSLLQRYIDRAGFQTSSDQNIDPDFRMKRAMGMYKANKLLSNDNRMRKREKAKPRRSYKRKTDQPTEDV